MKMVKKLACGVVCAAVALGAASAWAAGLPEGYAEVEYIQGNGTNARILTDYTPNHLTDKIEAVVGWDAVDKTATIWCTRGATSSTDSWTVFMVNNSGYKFRLDYGTGKDGYASPLTVAANTKYTVTVEDKRIDVAGGSQPASYEYSQSSSFADAGPIMLFASYWNGTGNNLDNYGKNKLYSFKVWRSGNLIHYFVPCKDSNNVATMVDICDNPATLTKSGTFTAGGEGHYFDDTLFTIPDDTLAITGSPIDYGSPSPAYGKQTGLIAGETVAVNCGATAVTNAAGTREYICLGWNLYDEDGTVVSNGTETAFTYTHPNPAKGRRLQWQWTVRALSAISDAILPVGGAAFHVDASMYSTMTTVESSDGRKLVTAWSDVSGGTMRATAGTGSRPWIVTNDGLPYVDFGPQMNGNASSANDNAGALVWSSELTTVREVFLVFSDYPGSQHSFFFGASGTYHFHRNQKKLFNDQYASANIKNGLKEVDGVECTIDYELPEGFHIIHLRTTGNVTAGRFAWDRTINYGGQRLQEVVVYTKTLTDAEAGSVYRYLKAKWFPIKPDTLVIDGSPEQVGSPDPAYGEQTNLEAGDSMVVSCGATVLTNGTTEIIYKGWKLYDQTYNLLTNGTETSFTYTHPSPAAGRMFEWQWKTRPVGADATDLLPTLCMTFNNQSLANTGTGTVTMNNEGTPTYVPSADGYALDAGVYVPYGTLSNVFAANRDSSIAVAATLGTRSTGILVSFRNASNGSVFLVLRRGNTANQVVLTENNSSTPLITVNGIENADTEYHLYVMNILSSGVDLYVDGKYAGTTTTTPRANAFAAWQIGSRHGGVISGEAKYSGLIDDIRVYASALTTDQMKALGKSLGIISLLAILPIPDQFCMRIETPEPGFTVTNKENGAYWVYGEVGVASGPPPFDVAYSFTNGYGTVTLTGKAGSEYEGETVKSNYKLTHELLVNGDFESGDWAPGWTASGTYAKIDTSSSAYGPNTTTTFISGKYCAILQRQNVATQVFTNDSPYCAELSWKCKQRGGYTGIPYKVLIDGNQIFYEDFPVGTSEVHYRTVGNIPLQPGVHTLTFQTLTSNDRTLFLDNVSLEIVSQTCLEILPIPDQTYNLGDVCRPEFTVSNMVGVQSWTIGGDIVSADFDVAYSNNIGAGIATVTATGKGELEGNVLSATFNIVAGRLEDANIATEMSTVRRFDTDGKYVYVFPSAAAAATMTTKRNLVLVDALIVGGGGGGGGSMGGGGGGGGVVALDGVDAVYGTGDAITFKIGAGGAGGSGQARGGVGGDTVLSINGISYTALGGGGGGGWSTTAGLSGASGGGGANTAAGGAGTEGQGYAGATAGSQSLSGGGGGAGHAGYAYTSGRAGNGGEGRLSSITGEELYYGGGGGGGGSANSYGASQPGFGGPGGGGDGGRATVGTKGVDGLGGGGGGGGWTGSSVNGAAGGAGGVILAFKQSDYEVDDIPDQNLDESGVSRPVFRLTNTATSQSWTLGGDIVSADFDVEYTNNTNIGVATVSAIGKGEFAGERLSVNFHIVGDVNISTTDLTARRIAVDGKMVYVFQNAAFGEGMITTRRGLFLSDCLLVGGGGAGGTSMGGGGGGGGVLEINGLNAVFASGETISFTVGVGGKPSTESGQRRGGNGGDTVLISGGMTAYIAKGGGGGAGYDSGYRTGASGGSGGGGTCGSAGGSGVEGQGYAGGAAGSEGRSGGGGGAGEPGHTYTTDPVRSGDGGAGRASSITGEEVYYGGGGGGGGSPQNYGAAIPGDGGIGGGGNGARTGAGYNGTDGLGGGGGGGGWTGGSTRGGSGGSGVVILAFESVDFDIDPIPVQTLAPGGACPEPIVRVYGDPTVLTKDVDYEVAYTNNDALGTALVTVTGKGTFAGKIGYATFLVAERYYVKPEVAVEGDGTSWATAMSATNLFATLGTTTAPVEVWMAAGTVSAQAFSITNNFPLVIRGGFAGTEATLAERQSGELTVFDGTHTVNCMLKIMSAAYADLVIDRLKFCNARANGFIKTGAGGLTVSDCVIEANGKDVGKNDNVYGRGMNVNGGGQGALLVTNCVFAGNINNAQDNTQGGFGIYINNFKSALVEDSLFVTNGCSINSPRASGWVGYYGTGSAICAKDSPTTVRGSRFAGNICPIRMTSGNGSWGGGTIALTGASGGSVIDHCTFIGNTDRLSYEGSESVDCGGALVVFLNNAAAKTTVRSCTFAYNITQGGCSAGGITVVKGDVDIANTVFWQNTRSFITKVGYGSDVQVHSTGSATIRYSTVSAMDGTALVGANLVYDPETVFPADPKLVTTTDDFTNLLTKTTSYTYYKVAGTTYATLTAMDAHLLSPAGYVVNGGAAGPATLKYSPAIDAGDPDADCANEPAPNGGRLNAGAFGNTAEASCTATGQPEATVEVLYPDGEPRPLVRITMGSEDDTAYAATVHLVCSTGGVTLVDEIYYGIGNGEVIEYKLPAFLPIGTEYVASVTINAVAADTKYYLESEPATGTLPPYYGKGGGPNVIHVRTGADCKMDGTSWTDAYPDLGTALDAAPPEGITEIWLAVTNDYMTKGITLAYPLTIRGGFDGVENSPAERPEGAMTWLDGNNVYRTMEFSVPQGALLTVERIRFSHSSQPELKKSGKGDLRVLDCLFTTPIGSGTIAGRGIYATGAGTVAITNCNFMNLIGPYEDNSGGGALYFDACAAAYVDHCLFVTNGTSFKANGGWARYRGAAAFVNATPTVFSNCRFAACGAALREATVGGVVEFAGASGGSKLVNCVFVGNNDFQSMNMPDETVCAGAIAVTMSATSQTLDVENCTVAYNITQGKWNAAGITVGTGTVNLKNSIVYGNVRGWKAYADAAGADIAVRSKGILNMSYSLVTGTETNYISMIEGGITNIGPGMIYGDPRMVSTNDFRTLFTDGGTYWYLNGNAVRAKCAALDAHLRSITGYLVDGRLFKYEENSPAIDAGDPASDFHGEPDCNIGWHGKRVNMGAYGNTPEAAMTALPGFLFILR